MIMRADSVYIRRFYDQTANSYVLYCVQQLCTMMRTHEQFSKLTVGLGLF